MEKGYYDLLHRVQERHWWYVARRKILAAVLGKVQRTGVPEGTLYDLGCGVGANLPLLERFGPTVGVDSSEDAVTFCRERGHSNVRLSDLNDLHGLPDASASIVVLADVIEHLADEAPCLGAAYRLLKPGVLITTVPAFMFLWGPADDMSHHRRRYTEPELRTVISRTFDVEWSTYFNTTLFAPIVAGRLVQRLLNRIGEDEARVPVEPINQGLRLLFSTEALWINRVRAPFGVSLLCVGRKPH